MGGKKRCRSQEQEARHGRGSPVQRLSRVTFSIGVSRPAALSGRRRADLLPEVGESALKGRGREWLPCCSAASLGNARETGNKGNSGERTHRAQPGQRHEGGHWLATRYCTASVISGHGRHRKPIKQRTASFTTPHHPQGSSLQVTHWKLRGLPTSDTGPARRAGGAPWAGSPAKKGQSQTPACTARLLVPCRRVAHTPRDQHTNRLSRENLFP